MPIYFKCKICEEEHISPIQMDKESFEDPTNIIQDNSLQCPKTGQSSLYSKEDMFWKEEEKGG